MILITEAQSAAIVTPELAFAAVRDGLFWVKNIQNTQYVRLEHSANIPK